MVSRRNFLKSAAGSLALASGGALVSKLAQAGDNVFMGPPSLASGTLEYSILDALPGKRPLIKRSFRPQNYETPLAYLTELDGIFTPNDAFFVRWHLANIHEIPAKDWTLKIGGDSVDKPFELTLDQLQNDYEQVEVIAVCQCSGNRRGLSDPHVAGVQWGYGAMGNAKWKGVRVRDILNKAGVKKDALEMAFQSPDSRILDKTPDFIKSIPMWKAMDESTIIAYEMNGDPLSHWNGAPARLVVPGWTATYWMKQLTSINLIAQPLKGFWMEKAYRIPLGKFPETDRFISQETPDGTSTPITEMVVNSLITNLHGGEHFKHGKAVEVKGLAWDSGRGIQTVEVSTDEGKTWLAAELGKDHGNFSWRLWNFNFIPKGKGKHTIMAKATNRIGSTQTFNLIWNPAGYHNNVIQKIDIEVA
jgi:DMSO/TMAO reductase YedYZ molybdopterin-dependent catalytic subunit